MRSHLATACPSLLWDQLVNRYPFRGYSAGTRKCLPCWHVMRPGPVAVTCRTLDAPRDEFFLFLHAFLFFFFKFLYFACFSRFSWILFSFFFFFVFLPWSTTVLFRETQLCFPKVKSAIMFTKNTTVICRGSISVLPTAVLQRETHQCFPQLCFSKLKSTVVLSGTCGARSYFLKSEKHNCVSKKVKNTVFDFIFGFLLPIIFFFYFRFIFQFLFFFSKKKSSKPISMRFSF